MIEPDHATRQDERFTIESVMCALVILTTRYDRSPPDKNLQCTTCGHPLTLHDDGRCTAWNAGTKERAPHGCQCKGGGTTACHPR